MRWLNIILLTLVSGCTVSQQPIDPALCYPMESNNDTVLRFVGFVVQVDPTYFAEVPAKTLIGGVTGISVVAPHTGGDTFGGEVRAEPLDFGWPRWEFRYRSIRDWRGVGDWGKWERPSDELRERLDAGLAELHAVLVKAIDGGEWNPQLRRRLGHTDTRALAAVYVALHDPQNLSAPAGMAGVVQLCITYPWDLETEPVRPPPRVFIPTSRSTTTLFELDPEHVPALLDCYRRILEVVEGPHKPFFEEGD